MSPFNKSQYRKMLDGLDANEVMWSAIQQRDILPLGPDLHSKGRELALKKLSGTMRVSDQFDLVRETVAEINAPVVEYDLTDAMSQFLEKEDPTSEIESLKKIAIPGDLVVSRMRSYLREIAVVPHRANQQLFSPEFVVLRPKPKGREGISVQTLQALLLCAPAQTILARSQYGTGHPRFYEFALTEMPIPDAVIAINGALTDKMRKAEKAREKAACLYRKAESNLLKEIGLDNWCPDVCTWTVKKISESFGATGRLDAAYYSPKYDEIMDALRHAGCDPLSTLVDVRKSIEPGSDTYCASGIPFLRVADFSKFGFFTPSIYLDQEEFGELLSELKPRKNSVLLTKDGTVGIAYRIDEDMDAITSGAILHLTIKPNADILPDYLALALNSMPVQMQAERDMGGTVISHWRPDQILAALIPLPPLKEQRALAKLSGESFRLRRESQRLLNAAVRAVECAVEKGEKAGLKMLEKLTA